MVLPVPDSVILHLAQLHDLVGILMQSAGFQVGYVGEMLGAGFWVGFPYIWEDHYAHVSCIAGPLHTFLKNNPQLWPLVAVVRAPKPIYSVPTLENDLDLLSHSASSVLRRNKLLDEISDPPL